MSENAFKRYLLQKMGTRWHVQSHEDMLSAGIPDLSYGMRGVCGWIELKYVPSGRTGILRPTKFTPNQVNWLKKRGKKSGFCFVLVQVVGVGYFLFSHEAAAEVARGQPLSWYRINSAWFSSTLDVEELADALIDPRHGVYTS